MGALAAADLEADGTLLRKAFDSRPWTEVVAMSLRRRMISGC